MTEGFNYGQLMHKALRGLMAEVLAEVAERGLPGEHHFFITFDTTHPGVDISAQLRARFPEEMTIVLQEWFEDLTVIEDRFAVTLNFGDVPEPLVIPFHAIRTFVDPSVEFGLRFDSSAGEEEAEELSPVEIAEEPSPDDEPPPEGGGDIVSLDTFRKH